MIPSGCLKYRLGTDSFVRSYEGIGFIYNQATYRQQVFDHNGALFLQQIGRMSRTGDEIVDSLMRIYSGVDRENLSRDFHAFVCRLWGDGFLEIERGEEGRAAPLRIAGKDEPDAGDNDCALVDTARFLKAHFAEHPRVFSFQHSITEECNERCVHCYVDKRPRAELPLSRSMEVVDELGELGTLDVTFTGGEALSCRNLPRLISRARENDLVVALISNLTLLTDDLHEFIKSSNLQLVQTSVFSMDPDVHDSITRVKGSHKRTIAALERLKAAGVRVDIACPILRENLGSFQGVLSYGLASGIQVRCDLKIMAREDGDTANLAHRIGKNDLELAIRKIISGSPRYLHMLKRSRGAAQHLQTESCGVGTYKLSMKSNGDIFPCPGFGRVVGNVASTSIKSIWDSSEELMKLRRMVRAQKYPQCLSCMASDYCSFCPAKFNNEFGWEQGIIPESFCGVAHANKRIVEQYMGELS